MYSLNPKIENVKNTNLFIIVERLYSRDSIMPSVGNVGPSLPQVHRTVCQLKRKQDIFLEGEKVTSENATLWQKSKMLTGSQIITKDTRNGEMIFVTELSGSVLKATALSGIPESKKIPALLKKEYSLNKSPLNYGVDPIPGVNLYGRKGIRFHMEGGGKDTPVAAAKYNKDTDQLFLIESTAELSDLMTSLEKNGIR